MKRATCSNCLRSIKTCFCKSVHHFKTITQVFILQHPKEDKHHLSTALMAKLSFDNVHIIKGENFSQDPLINSLNPLYTAMLYPSQDAIKLESYTKREEIKNLIILDGTWKKTHKILKLSENLQKFKKLVFCAPYESALKLRKVPKINYLSTFESIAYTLEHIENKTFKNFDSPLKYTQEKIKILSNHKER